MPKKRSLAQALDNLSPQERAFLEAATPQAIAPPLVMESPVPAPLAPLPSAEAPEQLVTVTFRLPSKLVSSLLRSSADRKIRRVKPWTQQEIIASALQQWLDSQA